MKPINYLIIFIILILGLTLRVYKLDTLPELNPDEAALGYNAYSLLLTGRDEHGISWPIHFKSFGDYKPGGYVYLAMPFIKVMGLTPLAVRLPNLIFSVLTIFILYKLVLLLSSNNSLANISALVLSISPWHIHFSRGAWESSTALFFIVLGIYWFFIFLNNLKPKFLFLSLLSFIASLYIYHSARLISPLIVISLCIIFYRLLITNYKKLLLPCLVAFILVLPVAMSFFQSGGTTRLGGVGLSADRGPLNRAEELLNHHGNTKLFNRIIHNRRLLYFLSWAENYTSHFDLNYLFINGDEVPRSKSPEMGQLYLIELPLLILGIIFLFRTNLFVFKSKLFLFLFLFIAPLASSLTFQAPSALRSLALTIPLSVFVTLGIYNFSQLTKKYFPHNIFLLTVIYIFSLYYFADAYFIHAPKRYPFAWNTGFNEIMPVIDSLKPKYENIYFTDTYDQPYILYLFFTKYDPLKIQSQISLTSPDRFGFSTVPKIDNIHFGKIDYDSVPLNSLIIAGTENIPVPPTLLIHFPNSTIGFKIYEK